MFRVMLAVVFRVMFRVMFTVWRYLALSGAVWSYLALSGAIWRYLVLSGATWRYLDRALRPHAGHHQNCKKMPKKKRTIIAPPRKAGLAQILVAAVDSLLCSFSFSAS